MGASKSNEFTRKQNQIAIMMKAFGHPARVAIIERLIQVKSCICDDFVKELPLSQPTISQHLRQLAQTGFIKGTTFKNTVLYCLNENAIFSIQDYCTELSMLLKKKS